MSLVTLRYGCELSSSSGDISNRFLKQFGNHSAKEVRIQVKPIIEIIAFSTLTA